MDIYKKIESRVIISNEGCWEWTGALDSSGYGVVYVDKYIKLQKVHRVMYELVNGVLDTNLVICHYCNNRKCCNPEHLRQDTIKSNVNDRMKDRSHHWTKLNRQQISEIYELHESGIGYLNISKKYNVSKGTIAAIIKKRSWNW